MPAHTTAVTGDASSQDEGSEDGDDDGMSASSFDMDAPSEPEEDLEEPMETEGSMAAAGGARKRVDESHLRDYLKVVNGFFCIHACAFVCVCAVEGSVWQKRSKSGLKPQAAEPGDDVSARTLEIFGESLRKTPAGEVHVSSARVDHSPVSKCFPMISLPCLSVAPPSAPPTHRRTCACLTGQQSMFRPHCARCQLRRRMPICGRWFEGS